MIFVKTFPRGLSITADDAILADYLNSIDPELVHVEQIINRGGEITVIAVIDDAPITAAQLLADETKRAAQLLAGTAAFDDPEAIRTQVFTVESAGGTLFDYTTLPADTLELSLVLFSSSANTTLQFFKNLVLYDRIHISPGEQWTIPLSDLAARLSQSICGFPLGLVPSGTRITWDANNGPCSLRLFWRNGPLQFIVGGGIPGPVVTEAFAEKIADQSVVSSTVLVNDVALFFPVTVTSKWAFEFYVVFEAGTTGDIKFSVTGPAGALGAWSIHPQQVVGGGFDQSNVFALGATSPMAGAGVGISMAALIKGYVIVDGTAGNIRLQFAQQTSNATPTIVHPKSHVRATKVG